jgi:hypothetical protein
MSMSFKIHKFTVHTGSTINSNSTCFTKHKLTQSREHFTKSTVIIINLFKICETVRWLSLLLYQLLRHLRSILQCCIEPDYCLISVQNGDLTTFTALRKPRPRGPRGFHHNPGVKKCGSGLESLPVRAISCQ